LDDDGEFGGFEIHNKHYGGICLKFEGAHEITFKRIHYILAFFMFGLFELANYLDFFYCAGWLHSLLFY
jgi:hypothetical protein